MHHIKEILDQRHIGEELSPPKELHNRIMTAVQKKSVQRKRVRHMLQLLSMVAGVLFLFVTATMFEYHVRYYRNFAQEIFSSRHVFLDMIRIVPIELLVMGIAAFASFFTLQLCLRWRSLFLAMSKMFTVVKMVVAKIRF